MMFLFSQNERPISYIVIYQFFQEIRLGDADMIRALFERATSLSLAPKKMKVCICLHPLLYIVSILVDEFLNFFLKNNHFGTLTFKRYLFVPNFLNIR